MPSRTLLLLVSAVLALPACAGSRIDPYAAFQPTESYVYRTLDDITLDAHVFQPEGPGSSRPAVLFFHGGSWSRGRPARFFPFAKELAARGYVAISASYRLNGTHGTGVAEAVEDAKAAYQWLIGSAASLGVDPERVIVAGGSAGGHLAAAVALIDPLPETPPAALVLYNPALDTSPEDYPFWARGPLEELFAGRYLELSPAQYVRPGIGAVAVFHGTEDILVPIEHSRAFCERMEAAHNICELHEYPGENHGFYNYSWGDRFEDVVEDTAAFLTEQGLEP